MAANLKRNRLRDMAGEVLDYGTYVGGLREGIEELEEDMERDHWVGGLGDEIRYNVVHKRVANTSKSRTLPTFSTFATP
jgi:hypothetical protein